MNPVGAYGRAAHAGAAGAGGAGGAERGALRAAAALPRAPAAPALLRLHAPRAHQVHLHCYCTTTLTSNKQLSQNNYSKIYIKKILCTV